MHSRQCTETSRTAYCPLISVSQTSLHCECSAPKAGGAATSTNIDMNHFPFALDATKAEFRYGIFTNLAQVSKVNLLSTTPVARASTGTGIYIYF
jgi:hypothetical protein